MPFGQMIFRPKDVESLLSQGQCIIGSKKILFYDEVEISLSVHCSEELDNLYQKERHISFLI
jgi:hypothetical protein